jgi:hypothetical protein
MRALKALCKQIYQPTSELEVDVLRPHYLVISSGNSTDHSELNIFESDCSFQLVKLVPETYIPVILKMKAQR